MPDVGEPKPRLMLVKDVAARLGISVRTVSRMLDYDRLDWERIDPDNPRSKRRVVEESVTTFERRRNEARRRSKE